MGTARRGGGAGGGGGGSGHLPGIEKNDNNFNINARKRATLGPRPQGGGGVYIGLYVDYFVHFIKSNAVE